MPSTLWSDLLGSQVRIVGRRFRTRVIEAGDGEALLLLHGIGGHAEAYARNVVRLGATYRAMAIDLVWHGLSGKPPYAWGEDIQTYAEQVLELLDDEGIERAHVEGESLGGWVGMWLALHHADRIGKLVLNTTAGVRWRTDPAVEHAPGPAGVKGHHGHGQPPEDQGHVSGRELLAQRSLQAINEPSRATIRRRLEWLMASPDRVTDELVDVRYRMYTDPETQNALRAVFENAFAGVGPARRHIDEDELATIGVPTLVLWTDKNPGTGPEVGRRIAERIPGARFALIEDAAHWPQWEQPEEHDRVVTDFLGAAVRQAAEVA